jgi:hypothetical protein
MREIRSSGSVEGVMSNRDPYSDWDRGRAPFAPPSHSGVGGMSVRQVIKNTTLSPTSLWRSHSGNLRAGSRVTPKWHQGGIYQKQVSGILYE